MSNVKNAIKEKLREMSIEFDGRSSEGDLRELLNAIDEEALAEIDASVSDKVQKTNDDEIVKEKVAVEEKVIVEDKPKVVLQEEVVQETSAKVIKNETSPQKPAKKEKEKEVEVEKEQEKVGFSKSPTHAEVMEYNRKRARKKMLEQSAREQAALKATNRV